MWKGEGRKEEMEAMREGWREGGWRTERGIGLSALLCVCWLPWLFSIWILPKTPRTRQITRELPAEVCVEWGRASLGWTGVKEPPTKSLVHVRDLWDLQTCFGKTKTKTLVFRIKGSVLKSGLHYLIIV